MLSIANIFQPLIDVFESVLTFFHDSVGVPWGWAIVLLTVCVRAVLVPLTLRQLKSMARLQTLQPEMKAIQAKYKEDKQRQQQEMMKFYKENNVNPLGSCLPMVAQLPVFVSLYYMLRQSLRHDICPKVQEAFQAHYAAAHPHVAAATVKGMTTACGNAPGSNFLFIHDLTSKGTGITLAILIVLYVGSQLVSSLVMSSATMDPTQRRIMMFLPVVFVLFVIRFPTGLLVYWITTNFWTIGQQYIIKRRLGPLRAANAAAPGGDDPGEGGDAAGPSAPLARARSVDRRRPTAGAGTRGGSGSGASSGSGGAGDGNGAGLGGGLGGLIRKAAARPQEEKEPVAAAARGGAPPKPPRKKKKRSGRRR